MGQHEAQKSKDHLIRNIEFHHEHCGGTKAALVYDVAVCSAGGILIGSWQKHHGVFPETLEAVTEKVKTEGEYPYDKLPILLVAALLPLIFGGAIGPEAGITGQRPSGHGTLQAAAGNRQRQHGLEEGDHLPNDLFHGCHRLCLRHLDQRHRGSTGTIEATFVVVVVTASMLGLRLWLKILQALQGSCETTYHLHDFKVLRFCFLHLKSFQLVLVFRNFLTGLLDLVFDFQNFSVCHKCFSLSFFVNPSSSDRSL